MSYLERLKYRSFAFYNAGWRRRFISGRNDAVIAKPIMLNEPQHDKSFMIMNPSTPHFKNSIDSVQLR